MSDLTATFTVDATRQQAFDAINDVRSWWSGNIVGRTDEVGAEWYYLVPDLHFSRQSITELVPGERVVWEFTDGYLAFISDKKEWTGTVGRFDISEKDGQTQVTFTHEGLTRGDECFDVCYDAWTHYITVSLRERIESGAGRPRSHEDDPRAAAEARNASLAN
ncbi:MAG TPA: SRPBCC domain-containing protein [Aeromicrobium sp.]|nr:SRPBCC domain-containing protein [Aeromicrobium sp.]